MKRSIRHPVSPFAEHGWRPGSSLEEAPVERELVGALGDRGQAIGLMESVLADKEQTLGPDDESTAATRSQLETLRAGEPQG